MKSFRHIVGLSLLSLLISALARGEAPRTRHVLTDIAEIRALRQDQAANPVPVDVKGTVLFYDFCPVPASPYQILFISDGTTGIYVSVEFDGRSLGLVPGDRIEVQGESMEGAFAPIVRCDRLVRLEPGKLPNERVASMRDIFSGREDCNWVAIEGVVRQDQVVEERREMTLDVGGRRFPVYFGGAENERHPYGASLGARISVRGVVSEFFNGDGQIVGARLFSPGSGFIRVLSLPADFFSLSRTGFDALRPMISGSPAAGQVKVSGSVVCDWPGRFLCLSDGKGGLLVKSGQAERVAIGEVVDAVGFPRQGSHDVFLEDARFLRSASGPVPEAVSVEAAAAADGKFDSILVKIQGRLVGRKLSGDDQTLLLRTGDYFFAARLPREAGRIDAGLRQRDSLEVTGVCSREDIPENLGKPGARPPEFQLLLRSPQDMVIVPWWTGRKIVLLLSLAATALGLSLFWTGVLRQKIRAQRAIISDQTRRAATLEERNRIARDLHDTLAQGFAGTAFVLEEVAATLRDQELRLKPHLEMALRMIRHGIADARLSLTDLRGDALGGRDVATALQETARDIAERSGVLLRTDIHPPAVSLGPRIDADLLRIGAEALANALRHAKPGIVEVSLNNVEGAVVLRVRDDGAGFDPEELRLKAGHFGILGMQERARRMQGELSVTSAPGEGTEIRLSVRASETKEKDQ